MANKPAGTARFAARFGSAPGRVRIIGGSLRGSKLDILDAPGLRPAPDRVRETGSFNWLVPVIDGARCLDLFAGTGALGIEALSRGAAVVDFVESDARLVAQLRANLLRLKQTASTLVRWRESIRSNRPNTTSRHRFHRPALCGRTCSESSIEAMEIKSRC